MTGTTLTWVFAKAVFPESREGFAAAVVITIPLFVVVGTYAILLFCSQIATQECAGGILTGLIFLVAAISGILDLVGAGLLITAITKAPSQLDSPGGAIACGVFATISVVVAAFTNFGAGVGLANSGSQDTRKLVEDS